MHPFLQPTLAVGPFLINYFSSVELVEQLVSVALKPPSICLLSVGLFVFCPSVRIPVIVTTPSTVTMIICWTASCCWTRLVLSALYTLSPIPSLSLWTRQGAVIFYSHMTGERIEILWWEVVGSRIKHLSYLFLSPCTLFDHLFSYAEYLSMKQQIWNSPGALCLAFGLADWC